MTESTFGELMTVARKELSVAGQRMENELSLRAVLAATRSVGKSARTLASLLNDLVPHDVVEAITNPALDDGIRAAVDARQALRAAAAALRAAVRSPDGNEVAFRTGGEIGSGSVVAADADPLAASLRGAGTALATARDLLRTHSGVGPDGMWVEHSEWAAVIRSMPVRRAMLEEVGAWARELAMITARLSLVSPVTGDLPMPVRQGLASSCHWLLTASGVLTSGQRGDPVRASDLRLLAAIPAHHVPARRKPAGGEPFPVLIDGVGVSAARLRALTRVTPGQGVWSPAMTADSWRWTAGAGMAICQMSRQAITTLAGHPDIGAASPMVRERLSMAAENLSWARERWQEVGQAWRSITTEAAGLTGPGLADMSDLTIRLGRIVFCDQAWGPERKRSAPVPGPLDLAADQGEATAVVAAIHLAVDALAHMAGADKAAVELAIRARRLHVPTRLLPEQYDVPRKFGPAPPAMTAALRDAYQAVSEAMRDAVTVMDGLATAIDAPSRIVADARAAARSLGESAPRSIRNEQAGAASVVARDHSQERPAGRVEQAVRKLNPPDPVLLLRARAIDEAAEAAMEQARLSSEQTSLPERPHPSQSTYEFRRSTARRRLGR